MKTLPKITPSREQLALLSQNRLGAEVIRGAAGSGKTTTALLRLRSLLSMVHARLDREGIDRPVKVLVLTFNRTLAGYVRALAEEEITGTISVELTIDTFSRWAMVHLGNPRIVQERARETKLIELLRGFSLAHNYLINEIDYLLGRFLPEDVESYVTTERTGRGAQPRVVATLRRQILDNVVTPYQDWLKSNRTLDWNGMHVRMLKDVQSQHYDIVVVDETQDFSANQIRAIKHHLSSDYAAVFVIDTVQRIYPRGFTWLETGIPINPGRTHTLGENHRNTQQIARFAAGILSGLSVEGDGAMPDLLSTKRTGPIPSVLVGKFSKQMDAALHFIEHEVDLSRHSVAFLAPMGTYLDYLKDRLHTAKLKFSELTREADWPRGPVNIAVCTFHSAKGLEFDHVFILGLNAEVTQHDDEAKDDQLIVLRRLLAVAIARARETVTIGYKKGEQSDLVDYFKPGTFTETKL